MSSNLMGTWDPAAQNGALDIVGVHAVVLHTGNVLYWCFDQRAVGQLGKDDTKFKLYFNDPNLGSYQLWDPRQNKAIGPAKPIGRNSFCAGQCALPNGTILVIGGQDGAGAADMTGEWDKITAALVFGTDNGAFKDVQTYDPVADTWERWPDLAEGRYYPTCQILHDGTAFIAGGLSNLMWWVVSGANWCENDQFETVDPGKLLAGPSTKKSFKGADQYPILRLLPGSHMLFVYIETCSYLFDLDSSSFVDKQFMPPPQDADNKTVGRQTYPMQTGHVLLPQKQGDPPRILIVGGSTATGFDYDTHSDAPPLRGGFIFDFNAASPKDSTWRLTKGAPTVARLLADTVLLPDGTVFIVNGIKGGAAAGHSMDAVPDAEIFDPVREIFTAVAPNPDAKHPRGYHSSAVLLPDGRVAIAGNTFSYNPGEANVDDDVSVQIYNPPYLFKGPRPIVAGVPAQAAYGSVLNLDTSAGPDVANVMLMRPCAVTHTVDMDQRAIQLPTTPGAGTVAITLPTDHSLAPPGHYMLFFVASDGTPSQASWVLLQDAIPTFAAIDLGTYSGTCLIDEVFDGDLILEKIDDHCIVRLESRHGSITIKHKIDNNSYAHLKAANNVTIGETIDQHSHVTIIAGGDVAIGMNIDATSSAAITSTNGKIDIGQKVNNNSQADLTAATTVNIGQGVDQHSTVNIIAGGDVTIGEKINETSHAYITSTAGRIDIAQKVDNMSKATLTAGTTVHVGQTLDQHSTVIIDAQFDVNIDLKIDQHADVQITSANGNVNIGQGLSGFASATIRASNGDITIGNSVDGGSTLLWNAQNLTCPHKDGTVTKIP